MIMTLEEVKQHLRVTHTLEDALIATYTEAAEGHVEQYIGQTLTEPLPSSIKAAVLLLTGDLYSNRERVSDRYLHENGVYSLLLQPFRDMSVES